MQRHTRTLTIIAALVIMIVGVTASTVYAKSQGSYSPYRTGKVTSNDVNVRRSASMSGEILGNVDSGTKLTLKGYDEGDGVKWYRISYGGKKAYIARNYVTQVKHVGYTIYTPSKKGKVTANDVNVRSKASTSSSVIGTVSKGKKLTITGVKKNDGIRWYRTKLNGKVGYISADYVSITTSSSPSSKKDDTDKTVDYKTHKTGKTAAKGVKIRAKASTGATVYGKFNKGVKITLKGYTVSGSKKWYRISYDGRKAYVSAQNVDIVKHVGFDIYRPFKTGKVTSDDLNFRSSASMSGKVITALKKGTKVTVTGYKKADGVKWYRIKYSGKTGYVSRDYVKIVKSTTAVETKTVNYKTYKTGQITGDKVTVRREASKSSKALGTLSKGFKFTIKGYVKVGDKIWYRTSYDGKKAYISGTYSKVVDHVGYTIYRPFKTGKVESDGLNFRKTASTSGKLISTFPKGSRITITGIKKGDGLYWYRVKNNGNYGYVCKKYVTIVTDDEEDDDDSEVTGKGAQKIVNLAKSKLGCQYVYGAEGPDKFDCSGFVWWIFNEANVTKVSFSRSSALGEYRELQEYDIGNDASKAKAGDITFYGSSINSIGHTGICIGNGKIIHAATSTQGVIEGNIGLSGSGSNQLVAIVRLPYKK